MTTDILTTILAFVAIVFGVAMSLAMIITFICEFIDFCKNKDKFNKTDIDEILHKK